MRGVTANEQLAADRSAALDSPVSWQPRGLLAAAVLAAVAAGWLVSSDAGSVQAARAAGPELTRLLQAMAVLKAVMAVGAVWLIGWRLHYAAQPALLAAYLTTAALMAAAPGVMWHLDHVVAGGVLFHAGAALLLVLGYADRASAGEILAGAVARRRLQATHVQANPNQANPNQANLNQAGGRV